MSNRKLTRNARTTELLVEQLALGELTADPRNPRKRSPKQIAQLGRSIEQFGFNTPVLVDAAGLIIAGHARVEAVRQ